MKRRHFAIAGLSFVSTLALSCTKDPRNGAATVPGAIASPPTTAQATSPSPATPQTQLVARSGTFVDGEHPTQGTVRIVQDGKDSVIELDQAFTTSTSGPDLFVVLHRSADVIGSTVPPAFPIQEGDYVLIAPLKAYSGAQRYTIPATINPNEFKSVAIWCRQFNATFGAAALR